MERKVTVLLTTHDMNEIEKLCPRVIIIDQGRILYDGSIDAIRDRYSDMRMIVFEFEENLPDFDWPCAELKRSEGRKKWFAYNRFNISTSVDRRDCASYSVVEPVEDAEIETLIRDIYLIRPNG
jgi:ABC-2 type transport system ATP-binding protein